MEKEQFAKRLTLLRMNKGISARDMSLSLGQSPGYINNIENGVNLPSMTVFFYICDFFGITPMEFFDVETADPAKLQALSAAAQNLSSESLDHLIAIMKEMSH